MPSQCPACQRSFDEPGFCPFDGTKLDHVTPTLKLAFTPVPVGPETKGPTGDDQAHKLHSVSASSDAEAAIGELREAQRGEYDQLVGQTLDGRYYVVRKIGEGGMGVVFSAKHAVIERPLAIKVLKREVMRDAATIRRFVQEAKAASRIGHPNIVDVTDFGTTPDGMTYSVMEFVDGTTLAKAIKHGAPFPPERAVRIAAQIARALGAAHDKGIVHRDLKPENVFLIDRDGRPDFVKIVDFGIAKVQPVDGADAGPRLTRVGSVFGTPEYMAPEQASGRSDTDGRVDIYALGTILYEMIVGRVPHRSHNAIRTIAMQLLDPITPPSQVNPDLSVPPALEAVIMKALAKLRELRYQTMSELFAALDAITSQLASPEPAVSLVALPPGADPNTTPSLPPAELTSGHGPRRNKPATHKLHEPEFVADAPRALQAIFDDEPEPEPRRRWPLVVLGALVIAVGAVGFVAIVSRVDRGEHSAHGVEDATTTPIAPNTPNTPIAPIMPPIGPNTPIAQHDAAALAEVTDANTRADSGIAAVTPDAGVPVAGHSPRDAGVGAIGPHPRKITVDVMTTHAADIYDGPAFRRFRGPSGAYLEEPYGTTLTVECRAKGFKGQVKIAFDGSRTTVMCNALPLPICPPDGLKPFGGCVDPDGQ